MYIYIQHNCILIHPIMIVVCIFEWMNVYSFFMLFITSCSISWLRFAFLPSYLEMDFWISCSVADNIDFNCGALNLITAVDQLISSYVEVKVFIMKGWAFHLIV